MYQEICVCLNNYHTISCDTLQLNVNVLLNETATNIFCSVLTAEAKSISCMCGFLFIYFSLKAT